jgi:hypothetical protein
MQSNSKLNISSESTHVKGVNATAGGLVKATLGAAIAAGAILTFVWLPAEYGIDPTGVGKMLGLTEMGNIKVQLHAEADADTESTKVNQTRVLDLSASEINLKLDAIQSQLTAIAVSVGATLITADKLAAEPAETPTSASQADSSVTAWRDEVDYTLDPGEGIELKLTMDEGAMAEFEWSANGSILNHDTHGDGNGQSISYEQGRSVPEQTGQLIAAFNGNHGWFWRNRTDVPVVVTLRTRGAYKEMVLP